MFEPSIRFLTVRGISIGAHWSWLLVFALVFWSLATALFPATYPGLEGSTYMLMGLVAALLLFGSVLLHELGHALRALREGMPIEGITLWLFGGVARLRGNPPSAGAEFRVAAFGPLITAGLVAVFGALALVGDAAGLPDPAQGVVDYLTRINLILLGFNLVPALPLDGGRVLRAWLWRRQESFTAATRSAAAAGRAFGYMLITVGLLGLFGGQGVGGIWFAFIGWFLVQAAQSEALSAVLRQGLRGVRVRDAMTPEPSVVAPGTTVAELVERIGRSPRFSTFPVVRDGRPLGVVSLRAVAGVPGHERAGTRVEEVMTPNDDVATVEPDQELTEVLPGLQGGSRRALVVDGGRLVGMLSPADVSRAVEAAQLRGPADEPEPRRAGLLVWLVVGLAMLLAASAIYHPPYVVLSPGGTIDVGRDVQISGVPVDDLNGRYLLTGVRLSHPSGLGALVAALREDRHVVRMSAVVPRGVDPEEFSRAQRAVFEESRMMAAAAAARSQGLDVSVTGTGARVVEVLRGAPAAEQLRPGDVIVAIDGEEVQTARSLPDIIRSRPPGSSFQMTVERDGTRRELTVSSTRLPRVSGGVGIGVVVETRDLSVDLPFDVDFPSDRDVGGPSAGLAYAMAIADKLSPSDLARGRTIAATGTIDIDGDVGEVGGVRQKAIAAERAGASLFVVPEEEVGAARQPGLEVQGVRNLQRALALLATA